MTDESKVNSDCFPTLEVYEYRFNLETPEFSVTPVTNYRPHYVYNHIALKDVEVNDPIMTTSMTVT